MKTGLLPITLNQDLIEVHNSISTSHILVRRTSYDNFQDAGWSGPILTRWKPAKKRVRCSQLLNGRVRWSHFYGNLSTYAPIYMLEIVKMYTIGLCFCVVRYTGTMQFLSRTVRRQVTQEIAIFFFSQRRWPRFPGGIFLQRWKWEIVSNSLFRRSSRHNFYYQCNILGA